MAKTKSRRKGRARGPKIIFAALLLVVVGVTAAILFWPRSSGKGPTNGGPGGDGPGIGAASGVVFFYSCDIQGRLAPYCCEEDKEKGLGGVARMATVFAGWAKEPPQHILVDVGNSTISTHEAAETINAFTFGAFDRLGYDVVNCGDNEATLGLDELRALAKDRKFKLISANLVRADTRAPIFPRYHMLRRLGKDVAIIGLLRDDITPKRLGKGVRLIDPADALKGEINTIGDTADIIAVLAFLPPEEIYELARKFPTVNIFLGGLSPVTSAPFELGGRRADPTAVIAYLGDQGCTVGRLEASFPKGARPIAYGTVALLSSDVPPDPAFAGLNSEFTASLSGKAVPGADQNPKMPCTSSFVGTEVCRLCHPKQYYSWIATAHAGAYVTLLQKGQQKDPQCLGCHSTGYGMPGGFDPNRPALDTEKEMGKEKEKEKGAAAAAKGPKSLGPLKSVGCECCHGGCRHHLSVGLRDRFAAAKAPLLRPKSARDNCLRCHTAARPCLPSGVSDPYERGEYFEKIKHWER